MKLCIVLVVYNCTVIQTACIIYALHHFFIERINNILSCIMLYAFYVFLII